MEECHWATFFNLFDICTNYT